MNCACIDVELKDDSWESRGKGGNLDSCTTIIYIMNCACIDVELKDDSWESRGKGGYLDSCTTIIYIMNCACIDVELKDDSRGKGGYCIPSTEMHLTTPLNQRGAGSLP
jgi:hypothetical protein